MLNVRNGMFVSFATITLSAAALAGQSASDRSSGTFAYEAPDSTFRVIFPLAKAMVAPVRPVPASGVYVIMLGDDGETQYGVGVYDIAGSSMIPSDLLQMWTRPAALGFAPSATRTDSVVRLGTLVGRGGRIEGEDVSGPPFTPGAPRVQVYRVFLVGRRLFHVWAASLHGGMLPADGQAFLESFNIHSAAQTDSLRQASTLDLDGDYPKARAIFQKLIDGAPDPAAKAQAQRQLAISYAFTSECASAAILENHVIAYWATREQAEPQNAFYQEGEVSNEAARICFDAGDYDAAEKYYRRGSDLGLREPAPKTHPASLWDFRLTHALARINVRRKNFDKAWQLVDRARKILDSDKVMAAQQERFYPYLMGYVGLYDEIESFPARASFYQVDVGRYLREATEAKGNENDPYFYWLLAEYHGSDVGSVISACHKALDRATAHNPPSAFVHAHAKECLDPLLIRKRQFTSP